MADENAQGALLSSATEAQLSIDDHKAHKQSTGHSTFVPRATYVAHEIHVSDQKQEWPEREERSRKWVSVEQAHKEIEWRKDIAALLDNWASGLPQA